MRQLLWAALPATLGFGCAHSVGIHVSHDDKPTQVAPAARAAVIDTAKPAAKPPVLAVIRVESLAGARFTPAAIPQDQQLGFYNQATRGGTVRNVVFLDIASIRGQPTRADLCGLAADHAADLLLIYEHKTPQTESGSLVYKVVFESRARGTVYRPADGHPVFSADGESTGTLGGLTPLQMAVHRHVEPETKRQAVEKLADAIRDTLAPAVSDASKRR